MTRVVGYTALMLAAWLLLAPSVLARDIYVAIGGNDNNAGTSAAPYRKIQTAITKAVSNDVIHVRAGTYSESWIALKSNLTLISEDGLYAAKIYSSNSSGLRLTGVSNCEVNGFECYANYGQGSAGDGLVRVYNSDNIRLKNLLCHDAPYDCDVVKLGGFGTPTTNTLVENCVIYNPAPTAAGSIAECLDAHPVSGLTVRGCWIYHTSTRKGDMLCRANGGSTNVIWENNVFGPAFNNGANRASTSAGIVDSDTPQIPSVDNMTVRNNLFLACQGEAAFGVSSSTNVRFYNNIIWNYQGTAAAVALRNTSTAANEGLDFCNNIVCGTNGKPAFVALGAFTPGTFTHDYNLYWQVGSGGLADVTLESHGLFADPILATPPAPSLAGGWAAIVPQFKLLDASPAINAGVNLGTQVSGDIYGTARTLGEYDMGPYEVHLVGDVNADGHVDVVDLLYLVDSFGANVGEAGYDARCDFNTDNSVDVVDLLMFLDNFGR